MKKLLLLVLALSPLALNAFFGFGVRLGRGVGPRVYRGVRPVHRHLHRGPRASVYFGAGPAAPFYGPEGYYYGRPWRRWWW